MSKKITLNQDFGYSQYRIKNPDADIIDASKASFIVDNQGSQQNKYPFFVENAKSGIVVIGGEIEGKVPLDTDWGATYNNSAAVFVKDTSNAVIRDWVIDRPWDGVRVNGSRDFLIENVRVTRARDDAVEADSGHSGVIRNSVFEDVFVGVSLGSANTSPTAKNNTVTIDNVLITMQTYPYRGEITHISPFKMSPNSPQLKIYDSVIAIKDPTHIGFGRLEIAWEKTIDAKNNYFLNLSDEPLPNNYPFPGKGFTVLQGQEARDYLKQVEGDWLVTDAPDVPDASENETPAQKPQPKETKNDPPNNDKSDDPVDKSPDKTSVIKAINIGGGEYTAKDGTVFEADKTNVGKSKNWGNRKIDNTADDVLYRTEAYSDGKQLSYDFKLDNGTYEVKLHFAELWSGAYKDNGRWFDIFMEGGKVHNNLNIYKNYGANTAMTKSYTVKVKDGELNIDLNDNVDNAKLSALEIIGQNSAAKSGIQSTPKLSLKSEFNKQQDDDNIIVDAKRFVRGSDKDETFIFDSDYRGVVESKNGYDIMRVEAAMKGKAHRVNDFDINKDVLDISALLEDYDPVHDAIGDFLRLENSDNQRFTRVKFNADGEGNDFKEAIHLHGATHLDVEQVIQDGSIVI